ncbi:hypothetical protein [Mucilaginibacter paludis]|uniref:DUF4397 domain-containing protein n=1 Tax=Mucilaginibacter paludis DSM 18603 TaxID=714943 RepID=H1YE67_9SPHI|nr:hypothetical protein [Mucilaginibacter paludis]EHQ26130.1 hypothetical protein Mucpa_1989 [Mucilaginibacter paludis DSM 18603]
MKTFPYRLLLLLLATAIFSCKKGEPLKSEHRFGSLTAALADLPGTPVMDIYFNGKKLPDSLIAGGTYGLSPKLLLDAGVKAKLAFKKHGTDSLLIDTLVTIPAANLLNFRLAYSEDLGLKTFLDAGASVGVDSVKMQLFNNLTTLLPDGITVDGYLTRAHNDGSGIIDDLGVMPDLNRKTISKAMILALNDPSGTPYGYIVRLKDKASGQFLTDDFFGESLAFSFDSSAGGKTAIVSLVQTIQRGKKKFAANIAIL